MRSTNGGATWTAVPNVLEVNCFGFGAAGAGAELPVHLYRRLRQQCLRHMAIHQQRPVMDSDRNNPNNSLDNIKTISGDPNIYGQVYVGFLGSGYAVLEATPSGPAVTAIATTPSTGDLNAGQDGYLTLNMSEVVTVAGGTPTLTLNDGGTATYTGGSGTNALTFSYTVGAGQNTASLAATAVNLNGATIQDGAGNAAYLSLQRLTQTGRRSTPPRRLVVARRYRHRHRAATSTPARRSR